MYLLEEQKTIRKLEQAEVLSVVQVIGSKKGSEFYRRWRREQINRTEKMKEELEMSTKNVFEKLKYSKSKQSNTLFDRLRYFGNKRKA